MTTAPAKKTDDSETKSKFWGNLSKWLKVALLRAAQWIRLGPVSTALAAAVLAMFIVSRAVGAGRLEAYVAGGMDQPWWTIISSILWTQTAVQMVIDVALLLGAGVWIESHLGSRWYAICGAVAYIGGAAATVLISRGGARLDYAWGQALTAQFYYGVIPFLIGVAAAASVRMAALWGKRLRTLIVTLLVVMLAFAGSIITLFTFAVALCGLLMGQLVWGASRTRQVVSTKKRDRREIVAFAVAGVVLGTLVSLRSTEMIGALAPMRYSVSSLGLNQAIVDQICGIQGQEAQCAHYTYLIHSTGLGARLVAIMPLLMQLTLAWGLRSGRNAAWWGTMILQGLSALISTLHMLVVWADVSSWENGAALMGFSETGRPTARFVVPILVPLVLLVFVGVNRRLFTVKATPGTYSRFWRNMGLTTAFTLLITLIIGVSIGATKSFLTSIWVLTEDFIVRLLPSTILFLVTPQMLQESSGATILMSWAPVIPWVALIIFTLISFKHRFLPESISREEYIQIVRATQAGSMGWITTWEGNQYWRSKKHNAGVAYRADGGVALTVSDPAALEEDLESVIVEFTEFCHELGLIPAFYSVHAPVVSVTDSWSWARLQVAEETVLELADLEFKGKKFQDVRTALNRATKEGIHSEWTTWNQCVPALRSQIKQISDQWVSDKPLPEMGFTLGGLKELDDPEVKILLAIDEVGTVHGVTSWMPIYDEGEIIGWTLDFMRRLEGGFRPVVEYLIGSAALWAKESGYEVLSLSGAPLARAAGATEEEGSSVAALDQVLEIVGKSLEPVYGFRSLLHFKAKFNPQYVPVYLVVPSVTEVATVGVAIGRAYLPNLTVRSTLRLGQSLRRH